MLHIVIAMIKIPLFLNIMYLNVSILTNVDLHYSFELICNTPLYEQTAIDSFSGSCL